MAGLLYREDMDAVRERLTHWWNGGDLGRPVMQITAPRAVPLENVCELPRPAGVTAPGYTTQSFAFRVNWFQRVLARTQYFGEAVPTAAPDLAPNCLALYLGCQGVEGEDTVWCEPFIHDPDCDDFHPDEQNVYWQFSQRLLGEILGHGAGKCLPAFPDLIEGLDTLAAMRDSQTLLMDLVDRPDWVTRQLERITELYFHYYDQLYARGKDEAGGSVFWAWAPGRMAKLQCDFSAMISPAMFGEFMVPVLERMTARLDYCMYHWDGPGAIPHHDHLLALPRLNMIQWTSGAGAEPVWDRRWWPLYHKTFAHGKKMLFTITGSEAEVRERLGALKREFGASFGQFMFNVQVPSAAAAATLLELAQR